MPKSPVATQKFVQDELFKQSTLIAQALIDFRKEMRAGFKKVPTKTKLLEYKVELMGELKTILTWL